MFKIFSRLKTNPTTYRELTVAAVLLGVIQGIILNVAFAYSALKLGFSAGGGTIAAIIGYVFLRGLLRKGTIVENNINQTIASSINSTGTGVVFVLPALFLLHSQQSNHLTLSIWPLLLAGVAGAILGVVLIIPLRRQLIELDRLRFPTGIAIATIIRSDITAGIDKAKLLAIGFILSAVWKLLMIWGWFDKSGLLEDEQLNLSFGWLPLYLSPALYLSPMNFASGLLAGRAGLPFFWGGLLAWWFISPFAVIVGWTPSELSGEHLVAFIYDNMLRPLGIGILIGSALMELLVNFTAIKSAFHTLISATYTTRHALFSHEEIPLWLLLLVGGIAILLFFLAIWNIPGIFWGKALLVAIIGTLWMALAGLIIAQTTGLTDISPLSGISLISVTVMMLLMDGNVTVTLLVAIAVAVAVSQSADTMQDLKTGFLVGSYPIKQQIIQFSLSWLGVVIAFIVIYALWNSGPGGQNGFGIGSELPAPQATVLKSIVESVQTNTIPTDKFILGGIVGILLGAAPIMGLGILMGLAMYLPFPITLGYGLGCFMQMLIVQKKGYIFSENKLVPLAAGLIIGEALVGVGYSIYEMMRPGHGG